jgi:hypothetical protein
LEHKADINGKEFQAAVLKKGYITFNVNVPADSRYVIKLTYLGDEANKRDSSVAVKINGEIPFDEANDITLERLWVDELKDGKIPTDNRGNNSIPKQKQIMQWNTMALQEFAIFSNDPLVFWLPAGENTITIQNYNSDEVLTLLSTKAELHVKSANALTRLLNPQRSFLQHEYGILYSCERSGKERTLHLTKVPDTNSDDNDDTASPDADTVTIVTK